MTPPAGATIRCGLPRVSIAAVTLGALPGGGGRLASAIAATVAVHGCLWLWAVLGAGEGSAVRRPALARTTDLVQLVELAASAPPPPQPDEPRVQPPPAKGPPAPAAKRTAAPVAPSATESVRPALAAAAAVITAETAGPVDLTSDTVVAGNAAALAGGITAPARGTNTIQSGAGVPGAPVASGPAGAVDHSSPVSLEGRSWSCPWPPEADAAQVERQTVVIRVMVNADGAVLSAEAVSDPGNGFGAAAIACALGTRFTAARDRAGDPIRARSPPIRVTFIR